MLLTFIIMSLVAGAFMTIIWSSNGFANTFLKLCWFLYTVFSIVMLLATLFPTIMIAMPR